MKRFLSKECSREDLEMPRGVEESGQSRTSNIIFADYVHSFNDDNDMQIRCTKESSLHLIRRKVFKDKGKRHLGSYISLR